MDVLGIGDIDIDIYLKVDHIPDRDEKELAQSVRFFPGGMVANFLVALKRLGTSCGFLGPIGQDEFGDEAKADLIKNQVDVTNIITKENGKTYFCVVMLDSSGEKSLVVAPTNCLSPEESDISENAIKSAKHIHTVFLGPAQEKAISIANQHGITVSVDFEPDSVKQYGNLDSVLSKTDIAFINHSALLLMSKYSEIDQAIVDVQRKGPKIVCVTFGKKGALILGEGGTKPYHIDSFNVPVIDTTGAGDCFAAGFIHGYLNRWPLDFIGRFASATAALKITQLGGHSGAPSIDQVNTFLTNHKIPLQNS